MIPYRSPTLLFALLLTFAARAPADAALFATTNPPIVGSLSPRGVVVGDQDPTNLTNVIDVDAFSATFITDSNRDISLLGFLLSDDPRAFSGLLEAFSKDRTFDSFKISQAAQFSTDNGEQRLLVINEYEYRDVTIDTLSFFTTGNTLPNYELAFGLRERSELEHTFHRYDADGDHVESVITTVKFSTGSTTVVTIASTPEPASLAASMVACLAFGAGTRRLRG